jgi:Zn-dependent peptidase ImmA (M78 family)
MKASQVLHFEFSPDEDLKRREDGWGKGTLLLNGQPYWFSNSEREPQPVEWTWIDFLEHIADIWAALVSEQSYPFEWLSEVSHPGEIWKVAEWRWARMDDSVADLEEPLLIAFDRRHNLSAAWHGLGLPALTWLRVGATVWLCPEQGEPIRASFDDCVRTLLKFGNDLSETYAESRNPRVAATVTAWRNRGEVLRNQFVKLVTGLSQDQIQVIQGQQEASEYWEIAANSDWDSGQVSEGQLLAAARMTAGVLEMNTIECMVKTIRDLKKHSCDKLDELTTKATSYLAGRQTKFAYEAGYVTADFITNSLEPQKPYVDIENLLREQLSIEMVEVDLGTDRIDAIALWGTRGPCIVMNIAHKFSGNPKRRRMTLAHEFCHLLVDRSGGLPFCEVLGGKVDYFIEQRANAFAAELLLPRATVEHEWALTLSHLSFSEFVTMLGDKYGVSKTVTYAQIYNSPVFVKFDQITQTRIAQRLQRFNTSQMPETIRTADGIA